MTTYHRDSQQNQTSRQTVTPAETGPQDAGVKIDGLQQVVEMLKYADPAFRESLLKRLAQRDPQLAHNLRKLFR
jgi:hypothetical protein